MTLSYHSVLATCILAVFPAITSAQQPAGARPNLLSNASFEKGLDGWHVAPYHKDGTAVMDQTEKREEKPTLRITSAHGDDTTVTQTVTVKPKTRYRLNGYIKTRDVVQNNGKGGTGASLAIKGTYEVSQMVLKTKSWTKVALEFDSGDRIEVDLGPRMGHHAAEVSGSAWFADLSLVELGKGRK